MVVVHIGILVDWPFLSHGPLSQVTDDSPDYVRRSACTFHSQGAYLPVQWAVENFPYTDIGSGSIPGILVPFLCSTSSEPSICGPHYATSAPNDFIPLSGRSDVPGSGV